MSERRPATGSCPRCHAALGLAAVKAEGEWYCGSSCAGGHPAAGRRRPAVPEPRLYGRPRRFFHRRRPKELRSTKPGS